MITFLIIMTILAGIASIFCRVTTGAFPMRWFNVWRKTTRGLTIENPRGYKVVGSDYKNWEVTRIGDYEIFLEVLDKQKRQAEEFRVIVDRNGFLVPNHGRNDKIMDKLEMKTSN